MKEKGKKKGRRQKNAVLFIHNNINWDYNDMSGSDSEEFWNNNTGKAGIWDSRRFDNIIAMSANIGVF